MTSTAIDLSIRAESVQQVYDWYVEGKLVVNRRYQRKLVWKRSEKQKLIYTIIKNYPLPLILIANYENEGARLFEVIDGMQRLDAIFSFIENKYDYQEGYYDTSVMATSNILQGEGKIVQQKSRLSKEVCKLIANYKIPISEYKVDDPDQVDEIFRRINSNGRALSRQELRQAGVVGYFADLVREISTGIRGDVSHKDVLPLNTMAEISLSSGDLNYGIDTNKVFWVSSGIITRDGIRDSKDESLIADLLANLLFSDMKYSSEAMTDLYYGRPRDSSMSAYEEAEDLKRTLDLKVNQIDKGDLWKKFMNVYDTILELCEMNSSSFKDLIGLGDINYPITRYYSVVFWAMYDIQIENNQKIKDYGKLIGLLKEISKNVDVKTGANWAAYIKTLNISVTKGIISPCFEPSLDDPATKTGVTEFENILYKSKTETSSYDFKQGFHRLEQHCPIDNNAFTKILHTICGIANEGKGNIGYLILGVSDKKSDADRIKLLFGGNYIQAGDFFVTGVDHEIGQRYKNADSYIHSISDKIMRSEISPEIAQETAASVKALSYKGKTIVIIRVKSSNNICFYGKNCYIRNANRTQEAGVTEMPNIMRRFQ